MLEHKHQGPILVLVFVSFRHDSATMYQQESSSLAGFVASLQVFKWRTHIVAAAFRTYIMLQDAACTGAVTVSSGAVGATPED